MRQALPSLPAGLWEAGAGAGAGTPAGDRLPSKTGLGSPSRLYLKNAGNGESEAGGPGDQEEFREAQTKGENPAKEEAPKHPQEQPCVLETEDFLRCGQMETWKQRGERAGGHVLGVPVWAASPHPAVGCDLPRLHPTLPAPATCLRPQSWDRRRQRISGRWPGTWGNQEAGPAAREPGGNTSQGS